MKTTKQKGVIINRNKSVLYNTLKRDYPNLSHFAILTACLRVKE